MRFRILLRDGHGFSEDLLACRDEPRSNDAAECTQTMGAPLVAYTLKHRVVTRTTLIQLTTATGAPKYALFGPEAP